MEAATAAPSLPARLRAARFERECERLRPLGEAYLLRRFGGSLNRADAEDAVAEVLVRFHRMAAAGRPPQNLRATFFASVRNQAIDQLRWRAVRPTVDLEAAGEAPAPGPPPSEWAEGREDAARLQEALGRMRANYREAILLRFGLGMSVPEIAAHCEVSLPAAKKLVLRATAQARKRMEAIEAAAFCPQVRELAQRSLVEKHLSGLGTEEELVALRAHLSHCGACKSFLASLHERLLDLGSAAVFGLVGADRLGGRLELAGHLGHWGGAALDSVQAGAGRLRHLAYKASGAFSGSDAPAGALLSTGQKVAAVCTAGAATTATCLLSGAIGPGIGAPAATADPHPRPAAQVRLQAEPPAESASEAPAPVAPVRPEPAPEPTPAPAPSPAPGPSQVVESPPPVAASPAPSGEAIEPTEFGPESTSAPRPEPAPSASAPAAARGTDGSSAGSFAGEEASAGGAGGQAGTGSGVGFHG